MNFKEIFKDLKEEKGVSLTEIAKNTGIPVTTLSNYINRGSIPRSDQLSALSDYFGVTVDYLIGNENSIDQKKNDRKDTLSFNSKKDFFVENLSSKIRELRKETGISQAELAKKMDLQFYNIGNWEQGRSEPSISDLIKLADIFNISLDELVNRDPLQNPFVSIQKNNAESLSTDELDLIKFYRTIDKTSKLAIFTTAKSFYNQFLEEKKSKKA